MSSLWQTGTVAAALVLASSIAANAESFTVTGTGMIVNQVMVPVAGGKPVGGAYSTGTGLATYASGKKTTSKNRCVAWSAEPGSMFTNQGACSVDDSAGTFSVVFSCAATDCWGRLTGMSGAYANRIGTASWHDIDSADGKTSTFAGAGMWD